MRELPLQPSQFWLMVRRTGFAALVMLTALVIGWNAFQMLRVNGLDTLKIASFILFFILLLPIALSFWTAVLGFIVQWRGGDSLDLTRTLENAPTTGANLPRTAILMPVYNEEPSRVFAGVKATYESLEQTGRLQDFDFFLLSDTTDPDTWVSEELAFAELRKQVRDPDRLVYRNRRKNIER